MAHIVATGAGKVMMDRRDDPTHDYILNLTGKSRPRVLFVGTATGDRPDYILSFYQTYDSDRCAPHHLPLFSRERDDLRSWITEFDVIHVGGGNTANMYDVWRRQGVWDIFTDMFNDPANENLVFTGGSAGGICWFDGGTTDSYGPILQVLPEGLGFVPGSFSPHYDAEGQRRPLVHRALLDGELGAGWACGNLDSLHFNGSEFVTAISPAATPLALTLTVENGVVVETDLPVVTL
ncbi:peptidase E [Microbacterium sp. NC79]|uniref:Type 1 glutamine amidotransferase-like domain-containing protein n=2 Tax=unclassified Microbacterium TaxID=2609290 RepID=UPI001C2BE536|nr:peptidase E [Microbacterium sp. NC79]MBV0893745.1 peptidase E [Microbacterium sp. NC79]